jgi:catechol 2,3-dioxygenase-like lactoylglutathione lyase family enzyme
MFRGIDHVAHAVRDLAAAADFYRRLGFIVSARNRHPPVWGTQNHIVQLAGSYIEILGLADTSMTAPHGAHYFSFGAFACDFLGETEGLAMVALQGRGAEDAARFRSDGLGDFETFELRREGIKPDGTPVKLAFSLAFVRDPAAPRAGFFTCQHRYPENFWNPALQNHANTATAVAGVVLVANDPAEHRAFLSSFTVMNATADGSRVSFKGPRGDIDVLTPAAFHAHFGTEPPPITQGARLAALRLSVSDQGAAAAVIQRSGLHASRQERQLVIAPESAFGATLVFEGN